MNTSLWLLLLFFFFLSTLHFSPLSLSLTFFSSSKGCTVISSMENKEQAEANEKMWIECNKQVTIINQCKKTYHIISSFIFMLFKVSVNVNHSWIVVVN